MNLNLKGKTALITGAAGGIGVEIARVLAAEGVRLGLHYRTSASEAKKLAAELPAHSFLLVQGDLSRESEVENVFETVEKNLAPVDLLVANAAIWESKTVPLLDLSLEQWNHTLTTNLTGTFLCLRQFFRGIKKHSLSEPAAVLIGSTAGVYGEAGHADYAASKSALTGGLLLSLKNEMVALSPRGRINAISPSWVLTPMVKDFAQDRARVKKTLQTVALRKVGRPADVAHLTAFLCSSHTAGHLSGQNIVLAGGMEGRVLFEPEEIDLTNI